jgi:hypothetical protein
MKFILQGWVQNVQAPRNQKDQPANRIATIPIDPSVNGKEPSIFGGKMTGGLNLQNVSDELAAALEGDVQVEIALTITRKPQVAAPAA